MSESESDIEKASGACTLTIHQTFHHTAASQPVYSMHDSVFELGVHL